jgi:hypothetical protein
VSVLAVEAPVSVGRDVAVLGGVAGSGYLLVRLWDELSGYELSDEELLRQLQAVKPGVKRCLACSLFACDCPSQCATVIESTSFMTCPDCQGSGVEVACGEALYCSFCYGHGIVEGPAGPRSRRQAEALALAAQASTMPKPTSVWNRPVLARVPFENDPW